MRIFKNKAFTKWAEKEGLNDDALQIAVDEMERGLIDADLGGHVVKKRVAVGGRGKRVSAPCWRINPVLRHFLCMGSPRMHV